LPNEWPHGHDCPTPGRYHAANAPDERLDVQTLSVFTEGRQIRYTCMDCGEVCACGECVAL
jgi:hypothetical protein